MKRSDPRPSAIRFAAVVIALESARHGDAPLVIVREIGATLHARVGAVIGSHGFDVLFARAVVLARRDHPTLATAHTAPGGALVLDEEETLDPDPMRAAIVAVVASLVEVLADLIGEDLALRLARDAWPETTGGALSEPDEKKK